MCTVIFALDVPCTFGFISQVCLLNCIPFLCIPYCCFRSVKWSEVAKSGDLDIETTKCVAYSAVSSHAAHDQTQQIPGIQDVTYEVIPGEIEEPPPHTQRPTESEYETVHSV